MMIESLPGILYFYNEEKSFLRWNKNFETVSGYSGEEITGMNPLDFFLEEEKELVKQRIDEVFENEDSFVDARFLSKNGTTTPYFFTGIKLVFEGMNCLVGVGIDIAARKNAEEQLRIAAIAFEAQEGIAVSDANETILRVNQSFTKITGYEANESIGQKASMLKSGYHDSKFYDEMWEAIKKDNHWQGEVINLHKNGEHSPVWLTITAVTNDKDEVINYVSTFSDLTQFKKDKEKIHSLAFYDSLTGLPNRRLLYEHLNQIILHISTNQNYGALLFIDLDNFKTLNDTKGHNFGDILLIEVAKRIKGCLRESDFVARLGGDEFVVLLESLGADSEQAGKASDEISEKILQSINTPYLLKRHKHNCSASIGISLYGKMDMTVDELLRRSDAAMYQAKNAGRNRSRFYDPELQAKLELKTVIENDLHRALIEQEFKLHYQKQVYHNGSVLAAEVLIRWEHPQKGLIQPSDFISVAEDTGLILPIGQWVLDVACAKLKEWESDVNTRLVKLAINVSALQFHQPDFVKQIKQTIKKYKVNPDRIELELTESIVLDNIDDTLLKMNSLRKIGVRFSLDDFGTGYSSLSYLSLLPFDQLKIDQSFIRNIGTKQSDVIVQTIIGMAKNLGMEVIAEGVETELQREFLEEEGCAVMQGYLFSKPMPIKEFEKMLNIK
jgi:diguanylate cyclase (GGDEF)-like protein/PAS domain S-box-containing protein